MGFFSLSQSATSMGLTISEAALLLFGILLTVGLIGEYRETDRWKKYEKMFELFVIIGVAGELLGDGGIFLFSSRLQTIVDSEIASVDRRQQPRLLSSGVLRDALKTGPPATASVFYENGGGDEFLLALQLSAEVHDAGWTSDFRGPLPDDLITPMYAMAGKDAYRFPPILRAGGQPGADINIVAKTLDNNPVYDRLFEALKKALGNDRSLASGVDSSLPDNTFRLIVGRRR